MKIYISHSTSFDYENELYNFVKNSELYSNHSVILPHDGKEENSRDTLKTCDLMIAEVSYPSTGQGIELGWSFDDQIPIVCIYKAGSKPSSSLKYISDTFIEYHSIQDALREISSLIMDKI